MKQIFKVAVLPGDGIGPEVMEQALRVLDKVAEIHRLEFHFSEAEVGGIAIDNQGVALL
jgi:3-isopropylmalate dehydrogenase